MTMRAAFGAMALGLTCATPGMALQEDCEVLTMLEVTGLPGGVAYDGTAFWVADFFATTIRCVDPETGAVLRSVPSPAIYSGGLAWDGDALWVAPEQTGQLYRLDSSTGEVLHVIPAPTFGQKDPNGSGLAWDGTALWHADYGTRKLRRVDPVDGTVLAELASPGTQPLGLAMLGSMLVVADGRSDDLSVLDPSDGSVVTLCLSPDASMQGVAVDDDGVAYVSGWTTRGLHRLQLPMDEEDPWWEKVCEGTQSSSGEVAQVTPEGSASLAAQDLTLTVGPVPDDFVLMFASSRFAERRFRGGTLCVGRRARLVGVGRAVGGSLSFDAFRRRFMQRRVDAGETWVFQSLYRDRGSRGYRRIGLSDAVTVTFVE